MKLTHQRKHFDKLESKFRREISRWYQSSSLISTLLGNLKSQPKKNWKLWKCSWWSFVQHWKCAVARFWRWKFKKTIFAPLLKKATFFGWKVICFVEKWKKIWKWNWYIIWSIWSCLTHCKHFLLVHKFLYSSNYYIFKSADRFSKFKYFFKKALKRCYQSLIHWI